MNEPDLTGDPLDYEPMPIAWNLTQARRLLSKLGGEPDISIALDPGDCDDCLRHVYIRRAFGATPLALCSPCIRQRQRVGERLQKEAARTKTLEQIREAA